MRSASSDNSFFEAQDAREDAARARAEAERIRNLARDELYAQYAVIERRANAVEVRASALAVELSSARAEANELGQSRLSQGLEAQIIIESLRGECADFQSQASVTINILQSELNDAKSQRTSSFQSESTLQELLKQSQ